MVRDAPDLKLFQFDPKDLMIPLTTPKLRVHVALGLSKNENLPFDLNSKNRPESWWKNTQEFDNDTEKITQFAQTLFPDDPIKVDFPFFILGTWIEYLDHTQASLEKTLRFFIKKSQEFPNAPIQYLTVVNHYNKIGEIIPPGVFTFLENNVYQFLSSKQIIFQYEFMKFYLSNENKALTYTPDFLLPRYTNKGRKVLLEPHGVRDNLKETLFKLSLFRQQYGEFFCLVLIVPDEFIQDIHSLDPNQASYDFLWKRSDYNVEFESFLRS